MSPSLERGREHQALSSYAQPRLARSILDVVTSVVPYVALSVLMFLTLRTLPVLTFVLFVPAAGFLVRTFVVFHDCAHGSLLPSKRANRYLGRVLGSACCRRLPAGVTIMRSITPVRVTWIAAEWATSSR